MTVTPSWSSKSERSLADSDGNWSVTVTTPLSGIHSVRIDDGEVRMISDIAMGEVWMCSGQSNMALKLRGNQKAGQHVESAFENIVSSAAHAENIRFFQMDLKRSDKMNDDVPNGRWVKSWPDSMPSLSAVGYFFAKKLTETLDVPVGIIVNAWGGSKIELWVDNGTLGRVKYPGEKVDFSRRETIYNSMIYPLAGFKIRGFLWYQGESNYKEPEEYSELLAGMVANWRDLWHEDLPFYMAQLAPYSYRDSNASDLPAFVEMQLRMTKTIPGSGLIPTTDAGDEFCIHPPKKELVGARFAYMALKETYRYWTSAEIPSTGPEVECVKRKDGKIYVYFNQPLRRLPEKIAGFEVAGNDSNYHEAKVRPAEDYRAVVVDDPDSSVRFIQYAYRNYIKSNLLNIYGLPAFPFRKEVE